MYCFQIQLVTKPLQFAIWLQIAICKFPCEIFSSLAGTYHNFSISYIIRYAFNQWLLKVCANVSYVSAIYDCQMVVVSLWKTGALLVHLLNFVLPYERTVVFSLVHDYHLFICKTTQLCTFKEMTIEEREECAELVRRMVDIWLEFSNFTTPNALRLQQKLTPSTVSAFLSELGILHHVCSCFLMGGEERRGGSALKFSGSWFGFFFIFLVFS